MFLDQNRSLIQFLKSSLSFALCDQAKDLGFSAMRRQCGVPISSHTFTGQALQSQVSGALVPFLNTNAHLITSIRMNLLEAKLHFYEQQMC